jgi:hypothetical protein
MAVVIGVDPHKASVSIEARDSTTERLVDTGRGEGWGPTSHAA